MNRGAAFELFGEMRHSTLEEQRAFETMLENLSSPIEGIDMGEIEYGVCDVCGCQDQLERTYYYYGIKCDCHSPEHFEIMRTCPRCEPKPPKRTKVEIRPLSYRGAGHNYQIPMRSGIHPENWEYYA